MAWTSPMTFVDGDALTASQLNTYLRDNMNETEAAKATTAGGIFIGAGPNQIVERFGGSATINTQETTTSTSYTDLETAGPKITCNTGSRVFFFVTSEMSINVDNASAQIAIDVTGETTKIGDSILEVDGLIKDRACKMGTCGFYEDLTPGENTFTLKYRCASGNTATFGDRSLTIIPF